MDGGREKWTFVGDRKMLCDSTELLGELGHPGKGAGTFWRGVPSVANGNCTQNSISVVKILRVLKMRVFQIDVLAKRRKL